MTSAVSELGALSAAHARTRERAYRLVDKDLERLDESRLAARYGQGETTLRRRAEDLQMEARREGVVRRTVLRAASSVEVDRQMVNSYLVQELNRRRRRRRDGRPRRRSRGLRRGRRRTVAGGGGGRRGRMAQMAGRRCREPIDRGDGAVCSARVLRVLVTEAEETGRPAARTVADDGDDAFEYVVEFLKTFSSKL